MFKFVLTVKNFEENFLIHCDCDVGFGCWVSFSNCARAIFEVNVIFSLFCKRNKTKDWALVYEREQFMVGGTLHICRFKWVTGP